MLRGTPPHLQKCPGAFRAPVGDDLYLICACFGPTGHYCGLDRLLRTDSFAALGNVAELVDPRPSLASPASGSGVTSVSCVLSRASTGRWGHPRRSLSGCGSEPLASRLTRSSKPAEVPLPRRKSTVHACMHSTFRFATGSLPPALLRACRSATRTKDSLRAVTRRKCTKPGRGSKRRAPPEVQALDVGRPSSLHELCSASPRVLHNCCVPSHHDCFLGEWFSRAVYVAQRSA